jgi:hypothetical protein
VLAMLLFALFLEMFGWFILVGLFATVCEYILCLTYLKATHESLKVIYLLLIIHPTFVLVKNEADFAISKYSTGTSPESPFPVWSRKLALSLCKSPNALQW